jgi:hypothetical protein
MRRIIGFALLGALVASSTAFGASPHFKRRAVSGTDEGTTFAVDACVAGLGNDDLYITLDCTGDVSTECDNPSPGYDPVPGQSQEGIPLTGDLAVDADEIENGNLCFFVETVEPQPGECPNDKWTGDVADVDFTDCDLTIRQGPNANQFSPIVLTRDF